MESCTSEAVLYHDKCYTVIVIDLPRSIELATCVAGAVSTDVAVAPFQSAEPKGRKRERMLAELLDEERRWHGEICEQVCEKLNWLHQIECVTVWSLPRKIQEHECAVVVAEMPTPTDLAAPPITVLSRLQNIFADQKDLANNCVINSSDSVAKIVIRSGLSFLIPPRSSFFWASIESGLDALQRYDRFLGGDGDSLKFDLILVDPPWSNRSARHAKSYITAESQEQDPFDQLLPFMAQYRAERGYIAIWITNKASIRHGVAARMKLLGLNIVEEWIWVKVTASGEPVLPVDGIWRKPYEVLLLFGTGRRDGTSVSSSRRFIFGASDFHSRKPNLKYLFDRLFSGEYRAIEIFARNLTSGWFAWGNEVLKFQDARYWANSEI